MEATQNPNYMETKVLSLRLPIDEANQIDAEAAKSGYSRTEYLQLRLNQKVTFIDVETLHESILTLRELEKKMALYLDLLEDLKATCCEHGKTETITLIELEINRAGNLMEDFFKAQQKTVRVLDTLRREIDKGG